MSSEKFGTGLSLLMYLAWSRQVSLLSLKRS
jgi:hypothetical protein